ncbi:uncharacterized protein LOC110443038 [Mizuhopecten yessoensis]|uniref:RNA-binding protein 48 n=1 Tax=Mizuhopecten yessoensis TaxID=6573 RepID=A0A210PFU2_MIZYE|nr:uncharacterized protein LOC110443038 [Mizuhopecten yessoensis]OWF35364.1 RNA-binding protein 48 [Mizuhopecten yessoensis]
MAAPMNVPQHHVRGEYCTTRSTYREGRYPKAVKVYTINLESSYLLVQGVSAVGATQELVKLFALYGAVAEYRTLDEYPTADQFTDVFLIKFEKIQAARIARRKLDDWSFFSGILHVSYAPEYESVEETRQKLQDRRKSIAARIRKNEAEIGKSRGSNRMASQSQSAISGQSSSSQGQRSNSQWSGDKGQFQMKSFQASKSSNLPSHIDKHNRTRARETQRPADSIPQSDTRVPPLPCTTGAPPLEEEKQIWIPPPPKEVPNREGISHHSASSYEFARVRTAHSLYPPNYDARISTKSDNTQSYNQNAYTQQREENPARMSKSIPQTNGDFKEMFMKRNLSKGDKSDINLKQEASKNHDSDQEAKISSKVKMQAGVIVRTFKPQTAPPKFVPRQMMKLTKKSVNNSVNTSKDVVNKELRQNALRLGEIQGPVARGQDGVQEPRKPTETEESVEKTRIQIRKRVSEITTEEKSIAKKAKSS